MICNFGVNIYLLTVQYFNISVYYKSCISYNNRICHAHISCASFWRFSARLFPISHFSDYYFAVYLHLAELMQNMDHLVMASAMAATYHPYNDSKPVKAPKDPNKPKRKKSSFDVFRTEQMQEFKRLNPDTKVDLGGWYFVVHSLLLFILSHDYSACRHNLATHKHVGNSTETAFWSGYNSLLCKFLRLNVVKAR